MRRRALFFLILLLVSNLSLMGAPIPVARAQSSLTPSDYAFRRTLTLEGNNRTVSAGTPFRVVVGYNDTGLTKGYWGRHGVNILPTTVSTRGGITGIGPPKIMRDPVTMAPILYNRSSDTVGEGVYWGVSSTRAGDAFTAQFDLFNSTDLYTWVEVARNIIVEDVGAWDKDFYAMSSFSYIEGEATPFFFTYASWTVAGVGTSEKQIGGAYSGNMSTWIKCPKNPLFNFTTPGGTWADEGVEVSSFVKTPDSSNFTWLYVFEGESGTGAPANDMNVGIAYGNKSTPWGQKWVVLNRTHSTVVAGGDRETDPYIFRYGNRAYIFYEWFPTGSTDRPMAVMSANFSRVGGAFSVPDLGWTRETPRPIWDSEDQSGGLYALNVSNRIFIPFGGDDVIGGSGNTFLIMNNYISVNGSSETNFDDVRFTESDGETLLAYERIELVTGDYVIYDVILADAIAPGANYTAYIYYGNPGAPELTSVVADAFENFTAFIEVDVPGRITIESDHILTTTISRDSEAYLYRDLGADQIDDFDYHIDIRITQATERNYMLWGVATDIGDFSDIKALSGDLIMNEFFDILGTAKHRTHLWYCDGGVTNNGVPWDNLLNYEWYYLSLHKAGTTAWIEVWADADRQTLLNNDTKALSSDETFQYMYAVNGNDDANAYPGNFELEYMRAHEFPLLRGWSAPAVPPAGNTDPVRGNYVVNFYDGGTLISDGEPSARFWFTATDAEGGDTIATMEFAVQIGSTWCNFSYDSTSAIGDGVFTKTTDQPYIEMYDDGFTGSGSDFTMFGWIQVNPACPDQYDITVYQKVTDDSSATSGWGVILGNTLNIVEPGSETGTGGYTSPDDDDPPPDDDEGPGDPDWWTDPDNLNDMSEDDLRILADSLGVIHTESDTKADLILKILEKAEEEGFAPFEGCSMDEEAKLAKLEYLRGLSIEELRLECQSLGISYKLWREPEPYIILIFTVGYQCKPPDAFYDQGYFDPEDWDGDGVPNWDDPDMFDATRMGLGVRVEDIDLSATTPWIQSNGWVLIILLLFLGFMYSQVQKRDKPGSRGESLLRTRSGEYNQGARKK